MVDCSEAEFFHFISKRKVFLGDASGKPLRGKGGRIFYLEDHLLGGDVRRGGGVWVFGKNDERLKGTEPAEKGTILSKRTAPPKPSFKRSVAWLDLKSKNSQKTNSQRRVVVGEKNCQGGGENFCPTGKKRWTEARGTGPQEARNSAKVSHACAFNLISISPRI